MEKNKCGLQAAEDMVCVGSCGCVGYAYVPVQQLGDVFDVCSAIKNGTVFPELELGIDEYGKVCKQWGCTDDE